MPHDSVPGRSVCHMDDDEIFLPNAICHFEDAETINDALAGKFDHEQSFFPDLCVQDFELHQSIIEAQDFLEKSFSQSHNQNQIVLFGEDHTSCESKQVEVELIDFLGSHGFSNLVIEGGKQTMQPLYQGIPRTYLQQKLMLPPVMQLTLVPLMQALQNGWQIDYAEQPDDWDAYRQQSLESEEFYQYMHRELKKLEEDEHYTSPCPNWHIRNEELVRQIEIAAHSGSVLAIVGEAHLGGVARLLKERGEAPVLLAHGPVTIPQFPQDIELLFDKSCQGSFQRWVGDIESGIIQARRILPKADEYSG